MRDCKNCKHLIMYDYKNKSYSCEKWQCEFEPTVEAVPKADYEASLKKNNELVNDLEELRTMINKFAESYENRLKADMVAMLTEIQLEIEEQNHKGSNCYRDGYTPYSEGLDDCKDIIQQKINALKAEGEWKK